MELVGDFNDIEFYDDSKGTNVGAVVAALDGFPRKVVLIAGGKDKGGSYAPLAAAMTRKRPGGGAHRRGGAQIRELRSRRWCRSTSRPT